LLHLPHSKIKTNIMGKGDLRSKKGKMKNKSFGKLRSKRALSAKNRIHTKAA
jgi:ribosomal small subunit protein bTHX